MNKEINDMQTRREKTLEFRRALRSAISRGGWTQVRLASHLGVSQATMGNWLRGRYVPDAETVFAAERALHLIPGELSIHLGYVPVAPGSLMSDLACVLRQSEEGRCLLAHETLGAYGAAAA